MKAIVIGAGVVGSAVAYRLAEAGAAVTIVEGNRVGGGTSGISFAWTNSNNKHPRPYHDLNVGGMKAHAALADEFRDTPWLHQSGSLEWCREAERTAQREKVERLKSWGYAIDYISRKELSELEPDVNLDLVGDAPITFCPDEGWIDPVRLCRRDGEGGREAWRRSEDWIQGGRTLRHATEAPPACGRRTAPCMRATLWLTAAGAGPIASREDPSFRIPLAPTVGFIVFTPPVATSVAHPLHTPDVHLRPDGAGPPYDAQERDGRQGVARHHAERLDATIARGDASRCRAPAGAEERHSRGGAYHGAANPEGWAVGRRPRAAG